MKPDLAVLLVEDNESDVYLFKKVLKKNFNVNMHTVATEPDYRRELEQFDVDIILSNYSLPQFDAIRALEIKQIVKPHVAFIVVADSMNEEIAVNVMKAGADDYVIKENLHRLQPSIEADIKKNQIQKLKDKEYKQLIDGMNDVAFVIDLKENLLEVNEAAVKVLGYSRDELLNMRLMDIDAKYNDKEIRQLVKDMKSGEKQIFESQHKTKNGEIIPVEISSSFVTYRGQEVVFSVARDIRERKQAESNVRRITEGARAILWRAEVVKMNDESKDCLGFSWDIRFLNLDNINSFLHLQDFPGKDLTYRYHYSILEEDRKKIEKTSSEALRNHKDSYEQEFRLRDAHGDIHWLHESSQIKRVDDLHFELIGFAMDVTERKLLEQQLHQSQKMEAIGQLAGGVAHDFNNLLTVINGYSDMLLDLKSAKDPEYQGLQEINQAGYQAAALTQQLLAFSRKQIMKPKIFKVNDLLQKMETMLRRLIGEDIELEIQYAKELIAIKADPGQMEQVIMNLAVNARDAMPSGGKLHIQTKAVYLDKNLETGYYLRLVIADNGVGMDEETQERMFEPFFTTKESGKGTGLGLSTVYGIVRQSGGHIRVHSTKHHGTVFEIDLPAVHQEIGKTVAEKPTIQKGTETILVVEDDEAVRGLVQRMLLRYGYKVLLTIDGEEALKTAKSYKDSIHLVLTDVVMPHMSGNELSKKIVKLHPEASICFMSGYTNEAILDHGIQSKKVNFIQKPFKPHVLLGTIRDILNYAREPVKAK